MSVAEIDGSAAVTVSKMGVSEGEIVCTLIPLSVEQAQLRYGYQLDGNNDPAEIGTHGSLIMFRHYTYTAIDIATSHTILSSAKI